MVVNSAPASCRIESTAFEPFSFSMARITIQMATPQVKYSTEIGICTIMPTRICPACSRIRAANSSAPSAGE
jgi:hypothetical protein